jgi:hypothetical protein
MYVSSSASCSGDPFNTHADSSGMQLRRIQDLYGLAHDGGARGEATLGGVRRHPSSSLYFLPLYDERVSVLSLSGTLSILHLAIINIDSQDSMDFSHSILDHRNANAGKKHGQPSRQGSWSAGVLAPSTSWPEKEVCIRDDWEVGSHQHGECTWYIATHLGLLYPAIPLPYFLACLFLLTMSLNILTITIHVHVLFLDNSIRLSKTDISSTSKWQVGQSHPCSLP